VKFINTTLKNYALVIAGAFVLAFGIMEFLVPHKLAVGGLSGVATIIHSLTGLQMGLLVAVLNIPIFILGTISEGRQFLYKSLLGTLCLSLFLELLGNSGLPKYDYFLSSVYGGALSGTGIGLALLGGGTTGGVDILGKVLNTKFPRISIGFFILLIDVIILSCAMIIFRNLNIGLYSAVALFISIKIVDFFTEGINFTKTVCIITNKQQLITCKIHNEIRRGVTSWEGKGTYTGNDKTVLMCSLSKQEIPRLVKIINDADSHAFFITFDSREVYGKGFLGG